VIASGRRGLRSIPASVCPTASPRLPRAERDTTLAAKARTVCRQSSVDGGRIVSAENPGGASASTGSRPSSAVPASAKASTYSAGRKTASLTAWLQRAACTRSEPAQSAPSRARPAKVTLARGRPARGGDGATPARAATRTAGCTPTFSTTLSARRPPGSRVWSPVATTNTGTAAGRRRTARGNRPIPGGPHHRRSRRGSCGWCLPAPRDAREPGQGDGPPSPRWRCPGNPAASRLVDRQDRAAAVTARCRVTGLVARVPSRARSGSWARRAKIAQGSRSSMGESGTQRSSNPLAFASRPRASAASARLVRRAERESEARGRLPGPPTLAQRGRSTWQASRLRMKVVPSMPGCRSKGSSRPRRASTTR